MKNKESNDTIVEKRKIAVKRWVSAFATVYIIGSLLTLDKILSSKSDIELCDFSPCAGSTQILLLTFVLLAIISILINIKNITLIPVEFNFRFKIKKLIDNSCSGDVSDVIFLLSFLFYFSWIPDALIDYTQSEPTETYSYRPFIYMLFFIINVCFKPDFPSIKSNILRSDRKLLITGLSNISYRETREDISKFSSTLDPIAKIISEYTNLEKVVVVLSNNFNASASDKGDIYIFNIINTYNEEMRNLTATNTCAVQDTIFRMLKAYIEYYCKNEKTLVRTPEEISPNHIMLEFSTPVDYNSFQECYDEIERVTLKENAQYKDKNISINITSGTSILAGAMSIHAVVNDRELVCTTQTAVPKIKGYNPDITAMKSLKKTIIEDYLEN